MKQAEDTARIEMKQAMTVEPLVKPRLLTLDEITAVAGGPLIINM